MANLIPQPSINDARTQALLAIIGRLDDLDLTPILTNRIDSVLASALPFLTWQWDMQSSEWPLLVQGALGQIVSNFDIDTLQSIDTLTDIDNIGSGSSVSTAAARALLKIAIP